MSKIFEVFDIVKDQHLDFKDFDLVAARYIEFHKIPENSHKARELREHYLHLWEESIQKPCDVSKDAKVNLEEWINGSKRILETKVGHENIDYLGEVIYESLDVDHNKKITIEDFIIFHKIYSIYNEELTPKIFNLLDVNHNGTLSKDEIIEAVNQFFYSNKKEAPGNFLFGKL